jgi:hypothetical protein
MKAVVLILAVFASGVANATSTININGTTISCDGSLSCNNNKCTCNGVPVGEMGGNSGPCSGETVIHENGGGHKAKTASVEESVYISQDSAVCDNAVVSGKSEVENSVISGNAQIYDSKVSDRSTVNGVAKVLNSTLTNSHISGGSVVDSSTVAGSVLNGSSYVNKSKVAGSVLNGSAKAIDAQLAGSVLNGNATVISRDSVGETLN